jgi:hypothetical protein
MAMNVLVFGSAKVAAKEERFNSFEKGRISGHHIDEFAMLGARFAHDHLSVLLKDLCLDFAGMLIHQSFERGLAGYDRGANFLHATWTEAIGLSGETERWCATFV